MTDRVEPWEKQPGDTPKSWAAFVAYRDMEKPRSLRRLAQSLGKSATLLAGWSSEHNWPERVEAWDAEQDRLDREAARKARDKEIADMHKRHIDIATAMLVKAAQGLQSLPKEDIKAADVTRMVDVGTRLERLSRGDVGEVIEERDGGKAADPVIFYFPHNPRNDEPGET